MTLPIQTFKEYMTRWLGGTTPKDISKAGKVAKDVEPEWSTNVGYKR